jgi:hypothetical protein
MKNQGRSLDAVDLKKFEALSINALQVHGDSFPGKYP